MSKSGGRVAGRTIDAWRHQLAEKIEQFERQEARWRHAFAEKIEQEIHRQEAQERIREAARPATVPLLCEWLICLLVDPEFQEDRLGDYQERFADLWVPKFGPRGAVVIYVWHALRQARFIDWIIRLLSNGSQ